MNKTMMERICPACGVKYLFWLFGRTACNCIKDSSPKCWDNEQSNKELIARSNEALKQGREAIARLDKVLNKEVSK